jgi:hypothetical protein
LWLLRMVVDGEEEVAAAWGLGRTFTSRSYGVFNSISLHLPHSTFHRHSKIIKYLYTLSIFTTMLKYFNFDRCKFWSLTKMIVHSLLLKQALVSLVAYSTGILKLPNILYALPVPTYTLLYL